MKEDDCAPKEIVYRTTGSRESAFGSFCRTHKDGLVAARVLAPGVLTYPQLPRLDM